MAVAVGLEEKLLHVPVAVITRYCWRLLTGACHSCTLRLRLRQVKILFLFYNNYSQDTAASIFSEILFLLPLLLQLMGPPYQLEQKHLSAILDLLLSLLELEWLHCMLSHCYCWCDTTKVNVRGGVLVLKCDGFGMVLLPVTT